MKFLRYSFFCLAIVLLLGGALNAHSQGVPDSGISPEDLEEMYSDGTAHEVDIFVSNIGDVSETRITNRVDVFTKDDLRDYAQSIVAQDNGVRSLWIETGVVRAMYNDKEGKFLALIPVRPKREVIISYVIGDATSFPEIEVNDQWWNFLVVHERKAIHIYRDFETKLDPSVTGANLNPRSYAHVLDIISRVAAL